MKLSLFNSLTFSSLPQTKKLIPPPPPDQSLCSHRTQSALLSRLASLNIRITVRPKHAGVPLTCNSSKREKAQTPTAAVRKWREISLEPEAEVAEHTPRPAPPRPAPLHPSRGGRSGRTWELSGRGVGRLRWLTVGCWSASSKISHPPKSVVPITLGTQTKIP